VVSAEQLGREEVVAFLEGQPGTPEDLEAPSGGAWSSAWAPPFHPGIAAADPLSGLLRAPGVRAEPAALRDAAARHHCPLPLAPAVRTPMGPDRTSAPE
jgi:hypothetical protein